MFGITFYLPKCDTASQAKNSGREYSFAEVQKWIKENKGLVVSKSSITMVKNKCNIDKLEFKAGKEPMSGIVNSNKEQAVLEAFRALGIVS